MTTRVTTGLTRNVLAGKLLKRLSPCAHASCGNSDTRIGTGLAFSRTGGGKGWTRGQICPLGRIFAWAACPAAAVAVSGTLSRGESPGITAAPSPITYRNSVRPIPADFGISIATTDGYVYEVGDSDVPFTIQSISKAFVFALALETIGAERVESVIGVEPSGEALQFRSACVPTTGPSIQWSTPVPLHAPGLIYDAEGKDAFGRILATLGPSPAANSVWTKQCLPQSARRVTATGQLLIFYATMPS